MVGESGGRFGRVGFSFEDSLRKFKGWGEKKCVFESYVMLKSRYGVRFFFSNFLVIIF